MDAVKSFNSELSSLYDLKPPISKAKMTALTKGAIKAIKLYKHVVQSVEKFIQKCRPEYKIPGLYVIDSIVRQSRHQFGADKDVFAQRFAKNLQTTFFYLYKCPEEEKSRVIRVLNLWQKNNVFPSEVIQPLFDLANPKSDLAIAMEEAAKASGGKPPKPIVHVSMTMPAAGGTAGGNDGANVNSSSAGNGAAGASGASPLADATTQQLQTILQLLKMGGQQEQQQQQVKFNKKLLDFDYSDDEDDAANSSGLFGSSSDQGPSPQMLEALQG